MSGSVLAFSRPAIPGPETIVTTLFDILATLVADGATDAQATAVVRKLLDTGRVKRIASAETHQRDYSQRTRYFAR